MANCISESANLPAGYWKVTAAALEEHVAGIADLDELLAVMEANCLHKVLAGLKLCSVL